MVQLGERPPPKGLGGLAWRPPLATSSTRDRNSDSPLHAVARHYVLGCAQMYCFGGGGLQALMGRLQKRRLLEGLAPNDARCRDGSVDGELLELFVGAEMTRRTFTNCCNIMRRHGFVDEWLHWREERGMGAP